MPSKDQRPTAPSAPGIYIATLCTEEFVPVTQDSRYVKICARVNSLNVKVGKARDLAMRERNYWADFGAENVVFVSVAKTPDLRAAETAVFRELANYRKKSPKGGRMDWLEGIEREEVITRIFLALSRAEIDYEPLWIPQ